MFKEFRNSLGDLSKESFAVVLNLFRKRDTRIADGYKELYSASQYYKEWKPSLFLDYLTLGNLATMSDESLREVFKNPLDRYYRIYCLLQSGSILVVDVQAKQFISVNMTMVYLFFKYIHLSSPNKILYNSGSISCPSY